MLEEKMSAYQSKYRPEIDGLRAFAVLSVVVFHALPNWLKGGFIGVDIFFVISGFLITSHIFEKLNAGNFSFLDFFGRRIRRIFPALILVMISSLIFGWFFLLADEYAQLGKHIASGASFILNFILVDESGYFDSAAELKPMLHLWSLAVEEQFYIVWPLVLWLAWRLKFNLLLVTILVAVTSFYLNLKLINSNPIGIFFWPIGRFWELLSGSLLAWLMVYKYEQLFSAKLRLEKYLGRIIQPESVSSDGTAIANVLSFVGFLLLVFGVVIINKDFAFPSGWALIPIAGALLVISAGSTAWLNRILLMNPVAIWFGLISYPLYLWHWPILSFLQIVNGEEPHIQWVLLSIFLSIVLAWLTYLVVEKPIRSGSFKVNKGLLLLSLLTLTGLFGYWIFCNDGISNRIQNPFDTVSIGHHPKCLSIAEDEICTLGNPESKYEILVYGDSHALHLTAALEEKFGDVYKITVITDGSCFMGTTLKRWRGKENQIRQCRSKIELLKQAVLGKKYEMVITSQRWHGYGLKSVGEYQKAIKDRLQNFGIDTKQLVIVGSTSNVNIKCEKNNFRPIVSSKNCVREDESIDYVKNFTLASENFEGSVYFIFPHKILCGKQRCTALFNETLLYKDNHHLSKVGANLIVNEIIKATN
jgi:peptidoglycan/LPS O-acetylase OafA/YrhL